MLRVVRPVQSLRRPRGQTDWCFSLPGNLCWTCANAQGYSMSVPSGSALASTYQLDKFMKHTQPRWVPGINSVFDDPSTSAYARYTITSLASGSVALDRYGQASFIWYAGQ